MSRPPFLMRNSMRASGGFAWLRLGPVVPVEPAAASVWQAPHPELANSDAPFAGFPTGIPARGLSGELLVDGGVVDVEGFVVPPPEADFGITLVVFGTTRPTPISPFRPVTLCPS